MAVAYKDTVAAAHEMRDAIRRMKQVFGAPGEHGYGTPEGDALFALYRAAAALDHAITSDQVQSGPVNLPGLPTTDPAVSGSTDRSVRWD